MSDLVDEATWTPRLEQLFAKEAERANGLSILHKRSEALYSHRRNYTEIPAVLLSSAIGFLSVGSSSMFPESEVRWVQTGLGVLSLVVSVLNTLNSYFQWPKRSESHRISSIQYQKVYRWLSMELSLPRTQRNAPQDMLKNLKEQYDRLSEVSPLIPPEVIRSGKRDFEKYISQGIAVPAELNGLEKVLVVGESGIVASTPNHMHSDRVMS